MADRVVNIGGALLLAEDATYTDTDGATVAAYILKVNPTDEAGVYAGPGAASENLIGQVGTPGDQIVTTPTLDTSIYASGDTLFDRTAITNAVRIVGGRAILQSLTLIDKDDQGIALDLFLMETNTAFGTINAAPSITDTNAEALHYIGNVASADWIDVGGAKVASLKGIGLMAEAGAATRDLYICAITRGTPTHTAAGLVIKTSWVQL